LIVKRPNDFLRRYDQVDFLKEKPSTEDVRLMNEVVPEWVDKAEADFGIALRKVTIL